MWTFKTLIMKQTAVEWLLNNLLFTIMALVNSKYVADILNNELEDKYDNNLEEKYDNNKKKYNSLIGLYLKYLEDNKTKNIITVIITSLIIYPLLFLFC